MKAIFKIKNIIHHSEITINSALHLFDSLVRPIMTYGCEVWGAYVTNPQALETDADHSELYDKQCYDKLDLRFCKILLGVHRKATNTAVRGELGRYPMTVHILKLVLKFWMRVAQGNDNSILRACYLENVKMVNDGKQCWLSKIKDITLNKLHFQEVWNNQGGTQVNALLRKLCARMKNIYRFHWTVNVHRADPHNKLRTYMKFKRQFKVENYLNCFRQANARKMFTRLRISAHDLKIESGRYQQPKILVEERLCGSCNAIDDEFHFVMKCTNHVLFSRVRTKFLNDVSLLKHDFVCQTDQEKFIQIMSAEDENMCKLTEKYIVKMIGFRGHL